LWMTDQSFEGVSAPPGKREPAPMMAMGSSMAVCGVERGRDVSCSGWFQGKEKLSSRTLAVHGEDRRCTGGPYNLFHRHFAHGDITT
jgi:hypothetical protein